MHTDRRATVGSAGRLQDCPDGNERAEAPEAERRALARGMCTEASGLWAASVADLCAAQRAGLRLRA